MSNTKVTTENFYVIATGSVATYKKEKLTLEFNSHGGDTLKINVTFLVDPEKEQKVEARVSENKEYLNVTIYNASGIGSTTEPLEIATDSDTHKSTYLTIAFQEITDFFMVQYTIFEQK